MNLPNIKNYINKKYFIEYLNIIKNYVFVSIFVFVVSFIIGITDAHLIKPLMDELIKNVASTPISTQSLFINNVTVDINIIISGIFFSIFALFSVFVNGMLMGYVSTITSFSHYILYIIPHGIFELPALILSLTTSLMITNIIIRFFQGIFLKDKNIKGQLHIYYKQIIAIFISIVIIVILLLIAAFIEANLTRLIAECIINYFGL